jgi:SAM-dependent methyltransferase
MATIHRPEDADVDHQPHELLHDLKDSDLSLEIVNLGLDDKTDDSVVTAKDCSDHEDEFQGFLLGDNQHGISERQEDEEANTWKGAASAIVVVWNQPLGVLTVRSITILLSLGILLSLLSAAMKQHHPTTAAMPTVSYKCPAQIANAANDKDGIFDLYNRDTERHANRTKISINELLNMKYGAWGISPRQREALDAPWIHWYAESLQAMAVTRGSKSSPLTIYESACGVGLTLYGILELLAAWYNIVGLEVYGNDYIADDVVSANRFYWERQQDKTAFPLRLGHICHGDSTNLTFVPTGSFDLVMTGYLDPIVDPLNLHLSDDEHEEYCKSNDPEKQQLMLQEQALVEDWFAVWTGEMIRIAKPGAAIFVESIAHPRCQFGDWGGVEKEWWELAVHKYGWPIDMEIGIDTIDFNPTRQYAGLSDRYNVKMIKKQAKQN